jgi:hypothetical protein
MHKTQLISWAKITARKCFHLSGTVKSLYMWGIRVCVSIFHGFLIEFHEIIIYKILSFFYNPSTVREFGQVIVIGLFIFR